MNEFEAAGFDIPVSHELMELCKTNGISPEAVIAFIRDIHRPLSSYPSFKEYCDYHNVQLMGVLGRDGRFHLRFVPKPKKPVTAEELIELVKEKENA